MEPPHVGCYNYFGRLRDGAEPTRDRVSLILSAIDRIRLIIAELEHLDRAAAIRARREEKGNG